MDDTAIGEPRARLFDKLASFGIAPPERMTDLLGVQPGVLTPLGLVNDTEQAVTAVVDASLLDVGQVNFHPLINTESTGLRPTDLLAFIRSCGREPLLVDFDSLPSAS